MSQLFRNEDGQAVVEYILMVSLAVSAVALISAGFRRILYKFWEFFTNKVAAPSPLKPPEYRLH